MICQRQFDRIEDLHPLVFGGPWLPMAGGTPYSGTSVSIIKAAHHLLKAAEAAEAAGDHVGAANAAMVSVVSRLARTSDTF